MRRLMKKAGILFAILFCINCYASDPLPSWNSSKIKMHIIEFVQSITDTSSQYYVLPSERIAVIDNDGTLWIEQPLYTQVIFSIDRIKAMSAHHPEWKTQAPYKYVLNNELEKLNAKDFEKIMVTAQNNLSVEAYHQLAAGWLARTKDKRFGKLYTQLVYQPMIEIIRYFLANDFKVYIVSGGGQDFIRAFADKTYGIPSERVIGSAVQTKFDYQHSKPVLINQPNVLFISNDAGKPEAIHLFIGKKPIVAIGNSDNDRQMLEWTQSTTGKHLMMLVHHDDAQREYAYDAQSTIGTFSDALMQEAKKNKWDVISMKQDWKVIFKSE